MEHRTGLEDYYVMKDGKKLRYGYTTGSCAAAAAKAAAQMLFLQKKISKTDLFTPKGLLLHLLIEDVHIERERVSCAVRKDGGDDPDATNGLLVYAEVSRCPAKGEQRIFLDGGKGVGRVSKPGLEQPVGAAAINRVPRQMICREVEEVLEQFKYTGGMKVVISIPGGEEAAKRTFNPRLGIEGGISVLGTSGIVIPMSEAALIASIRLEMEMKQKNGEQFLLVTPGNYGADFVKGNLLPDISRSMKCSNYVGDTLDMAVELGFRGILFVAHIGKFVKVSGGIMNTHSRHSDSRAELMCAHAVHAGADLDTARALLATNTTEEALEILQKKGLADKVMERIAVQVRYYLNHRTGGAVQAEAIIFSNNCGYLCETSGAAELLQHFLCGQ